MNEELKKKLQAAIAACAEEAAETDIAIEALQFTQAAVNAANAICTLTDIEHRTG